MFKLMGKEINAILGAQRILIRTYVYRLVCNFVHPIKNRILHDMALTYKFQLFACWKIIYDFLSSANFLKINFFKEIISGIPSHQSQTICIQIRPHQVSGLIWIHIVCKGYQQTTLASKELIKINCFSIKKLF